MVILRTWERQTWKKFWSGEILRHNSIIVQVDEKDSIIVPFQKEGFEAMCNRSIVTHTHLSLPLWVSDRATNLLATTTPKGNRRACVIGHGDVIDDDDAYLHCTVIRRCWRVAVSGGFQLRLRAHTHYTRRRASHVSARPDPAARGADEPSPPLQCSTRPRRGGHVRYGQPEAEEATGCCVHRTRLRLTIKYIYFLV